VDPSGARVGRQNLTGEPVIAKVAFSAALQHTNLQVMVKIHFLVANPHVSDD
jgi:hypothetical protein